MYDEQQIAVSSAPEWDARPATSTQDALGACRRLALGIGASGFSLLLSAANSESRRLAPVFDSEFPGLSPVSRQISGRPAEGFARLAAESVMPLWWRQAGEAPLNCAKARRWAREVESPLSGVAGVAFPVAAEGGRSGLFVFTGEAMALAEDSLCDTHARCFALFADVVRQRFQESTRTPQVSKREIECLRLTANGMTSEDIATALGLSVHTANQYLTNSTHKLNAVNRIHAVAKALRSGLID